MKLTKKVFKPSTLIFFFITGLNFIFSFESIHWSAYKAKTSSHILSFTEQNFNNAKIDIVKVGDQRIMRLVLQPGWKWSQDIKPTVGTDSCKAKHLGVIVSGAVCAKHDDGTELTYKAGDAYSIDPGHDGWVVGDEPAVVYEFHGKWGE